MRLKEDASSWAANGIVRHDFRHDPNQPSRPHKARKDTKRWCKGKVGVKHSFVLIKRYKLHTLMWSTSRCVNCGKNQHKIN